MTKAPERLSAIPANQGRPSMKYLAWISGLLVFELGLAYVIPSAVLARYSSLQTFVDFVHFFAPVVKNFDPIATHPEHLQLYIAITLSLMPLQIYWFYQYLRSSLPGIYRHLVISPLTVTTPSRGSSFITGPIESMERVRETRPRSLTSRFRWSIAILVIFGAGWLIAVPFYGIDADRANAENLGEGF